MTIPLEFKYEMKIDAANYWSGDVNLGGSDFFKSPVFQRMLGQYENFKINWVSATFTPAALSNTNNRLS